MYRTVPYSVPYRCAVYGTGVSTLRLYGTGISTVRPYGTVPKNAGTSTVPYRTALPLHGTVVGTLRKVSLRHGVRHESGPYHLRSRSAKVLTRTNQNRNLYRSLVRPHRVGGTAASEMRVAAHSLRASRARSDRIRVRAGTHFDGEHQVLSTATEVCYRAAADARLTDVTWKRMMPLSTVCRALKFENKL